MNRYTDDVVAAARAAIGLPASANIIATMLLQYRYFVGWKLRYDGGHAVLDVGNGTIAVYDEQGTLLKSLAVDAGKGAAA